jgi:GT2 family glycosyltransferase
MNIPVAVAAPPTGRDLRAVVRRSAPHRIEGYVYDPADLSLRFVVELRGDGRSLAVASAGGFDAALRQAGVGDGCYRFVFAIEPERVPAGALEVRLANTLQIVGVADAPEAAPLSPLPAAPGAVDWRGGLSFFGWLDEDGGEEARAFVDGECVARARLDRWVHVGEDRDAIARRAFRMSLPGSFADGRLRRARIVDARGRELQGSPCPFFAFPDGLERWLEMAPDLESERLRGRLYDEIFPRSAPFANFAEWRERLSEIRIESGAPLAVAIVGERGASVTLASLETSDEAEVFAGVLPEADSPASFDPSQGLAFLSEAPSNCERVVFTLAGTRLERGALSRLADGWRAFPDAIVAYADLTIAGEAERPWPLAFPAFDYERMLEQGFAAFLFALPVETARKALAAGANSLFRLFNAPFDAFEGEPDSPVLSQAVHVPGFLAHLPPLEPRRLGSTLAQATAEHLRKRGVAAQVRPGAGALLPSARVRRAARPVNVSLLIPTRNRIDLLRPCIESLARTRALDRNELVIVDNDSSDPDTLAYLDRLARDGARILRAGGPFNFARLVNAGAAMAGGEFLLLLNNDVEALHEGWLEEMLSRAMERDVGAVGATLLWPSGVVQHGGVALGVGFAPSHVFNDRVDGDPGYGDLLRVAHENSAVTGACLLTPRALFAEAGGFDEVRFPVNYNDIDYCLRLRSRGRRIVVTPHARLMHREQASRGADRAKDQLSRNAGELRRLRAIWGEALLNDPSYSPLLSREGEAYGALAWPPRHPEPRLRILPAPLPLAPGF